MRRNQVAVVGAAETTELGIIPNTSQIQLHADAALNAIADAGLKLSDIDGFATAVETPQQIAHYLAFIQPWSEARRSAGASSSLPTTKPRRAFNAGLCKTWLTPHSETASLTFARRQPIM